MLNQNNKLTICQFAAKIKNKYPDYAGIPDAILTVKILNKYPEYMDIVDTSSLPPLSKWATLKSIVNDSINALVKGDIKSDSTQIKSKTLSERFSDYWTNINWNITWLLFEWLLIIGLAIIAFIKRKWIANKVKLKTALIVTSILACLLMVTNPSQTEFEKYVRYQISNDLVKDKKRGGELVATRTKYYLLYSVYEYKYYSGTQLTKQGTYYGFLETFK